MESNPAYIPEGEDRARILDKIYGGLMGFAIGNALGKGTSLMSKAEISVRYPKGLHEYDDIIRDAYRSQWKKTEWSSPTELMLLTAESLSSCGGFDANDMAERLRFWVEESRDIIPILKNVTGQPDYAERPETVSRRVWNSIHRPEASNECLGRAMVIGMWGRDIDKNLERAVTLTHYDTRCVSSGIVIAMMARDLLWTDKPTPITRLEDKADEYDERVLPYFKKAYRAELDEFELDDEATYWYVRKTMSAALWAVHRCYNMEEALEKIMMQGGSAEYNASLALGLMGLHQGSAGLPKRLEERIEGASKIREYSVMLLDAITESLEKEN